MKMKYIFLFFILLFHSETYALSTTIDSSHILLTSASFFGLGVLLAFTPCVLPMVPILSSILLGENTTNKRRSFQIAFAFVIGMAFIYTIAGMLAGYLGSTLQTLLQTPSAIIGFSVIFALMALSMFGLYDLRLPSFLMSRVQKLSDRQQAFNLLGTAIMGGLSTLIASPCITAPMVSILSYVGQQGNPLFGGALLFILSMGMGFPLILFAIGQGALLPKTGMWMIKVKQFIGILMLALSIMMLSRVLPGPYILFMTATLIITTSIWLGAFDHQSGSLGRIKQGMCIVAMIYGITLMLGAAGGSENFIQPLQALTHHSQNTTQNPKMLFHYVYDTQSLEKQLKSAKDEGKPALVEFYASWCSDCREFDRNVLSDAYIQTLMKNFVAIRVDISKDNDELKSIRKRYKVFGVPSIVFYDKHGSEIHDGRTNELNKAFLEEKLTELS